MKYWGIKVDSKILDVNCCCSDDRSVDCDGFCNMLSILVSTRHIRLWESWRFSSHQDTGGEMLKDCSDGGEDRRKKGWWKGEEKLKEKT